MALALRENAQPVTVTDAPVAVMPSQQQREGGLPAQRVVMPW